MGRLYQEDDEDVIGGRPDPRPRVQTPGTVAVDLHTLASALGLSERSVTELAKDGEMVRLSHGRYDLIASTRNHIARLRNKDGNAKDRLTLAQAELAELKLSEARAELVDAAAVQARWETILHQIKAVFLGLPSRIQADLPHLTAFDAATVDRHIRNALTDLGGEHGNA